MKYSIVTDIQEEADSFNVNVNVVLFPVTLLRKGA